MDHRKAHTNDTYYNDTELNQKGTFDHDIYFKFFHPYLFTSGTNVNLN